MVTDAVPAAVVDVLEQMSDADREAFLLLLKKLRQVNNDLQQLSEQDRALMRDIGERNQSLFALLNQRTASERSDPQYAHSDVSPAILQSEFYLYMREILLREWCARGGSLEDAVLHAFQQKWLPEELKDDANCQKVFARYQRDIETANAFRKSVEDAEVVMQNKKMAVGLAWFTTLYKLNALIEQGVDLSAG